ENGSLRQSGVAQVPCLHGGHRHRRAQRVAAHPDRAPMDGVMYKRILVPLEHSEYDAAIVDHVRQLAKFCGASIVFMHVADGFAARNVTQLHLRESEEMRVDREYLERTCATLEADGLSADCI